MFRSAITSLIILLVTAALVEPSSALGADLSLTSVTSMTSWEEEDGPDNSSASEYLRFLSRGDLGGFGLDIEGYGRFTHLDEEFEPGDEDPHRLYTLAMTLSDEDRSNVATLGRQFVTALVGPEMIDGLFMQTRTGIATFNARWGYRSDVSGGPEDDQVAGLGVDFNLISGMHFSLDYGRTYDDRLLSELIAAEFSYSWYRFTKAYANINWDLMSRTIHEALVGTRIFFSERFSAEAELKQNVQVFESDSIYSVFAVDAAYTRSFSLLFTPSRNTRYVWDYVVESYQGSGSGTRYMISGHWTPGRSKLHTSLMQHSGYGGDLLEVSASASFPVMKNLRTAIGGDISTTENTDEASVTSSLLYLGAELGLGLKSGVNLRLERIDDDLTGPTQSGRLALKVEF